MLCHNYCNSNINSHLNEGINFTIIASSLTTITINQHHPHGVGGQQAAATTSAKLPRTTEVSRLFSAFFPF